MVPLFHCYLSAVKDAAQHTYMLLLDRNKAMLVPNRFQGGQVAAAKQIDSLATMFNVVNDSL